ncbi:hypothetical protein PVAP13_2NG614800 [Panicum virgatum]|uniref:DUF3511 domain protein n=1 Tax=Panicum virgatum TaxID=38727 RepID=A0A8T0VWE8_PANVG|nr:hypothetical protein PVAP13_2NG614800 [Panicum virgatum]
MAPSYRPYAGGEEHDAQRRKKKNKAGGLWGGDPAEMKRRRRVAGYKAYAVESKVKASIRRGLHWIKAKCAHIIRT